MTRMYLRQHRAFTLIELLIIVMILGILAMLTVPNFTSAAGQARENSLKTTLKNFRTQIQFYNAHHNLYPGYPSGSASTPDATTFSRQLTMFSDGTGAVSATKTASATFGPYVEAMPANPINNLSTVLVVTGVNQSTVHDPDGTTGWIYEADTGRVYANVTSSDSAGHLYVTY
ncbi:MAG: prepilin-type N-terminal cleavage/methylation domain-containing protein [Tepidisphaeraceae bacterium]